MLRQTSVNENCKYRLFDISGCKYSDYGISDDDLSCMLDMHVILLYEYNDWYIINGALHFFKTHHIYDELFLNELIKNFNLRSVEYELVRQGSTVGIVSKSFRNKPSKFYDYDDYFKHKGLRIPRKLVSLDETFSSILTEENKDKIMNEFYNLLAFDLFTGQIDRKDYNLVIEERTDTRLAPIFDNECSFVDKYS